jgi:peroxiredoxin
MIELGELEKRHQDFENRHVRIVAVSNDDQETAQKTQADFPHLVVVADAEQHMAKAVEVIHEKKGPQSSDTNVPTTFLINANGKVSRVLQPDHFITRLSPDDVLAAVDATWPKK